MLGWSSLDFVRSKFQLPAFSFSTSPFFPGFHCDWLTLPSKHLSFWLKLSWWLPVPYAGGASIRPNDGANVTLAWRCHVNVQHGLKNRMAVVCLVVADSVSTCPQLDELSLLLTRLQRHQSKLASVRNFAVGQLLHHYLTFPACQVSAGWPSWAPAGMACLPYFPVPCSGLSCWLAICLFPCLFASGCYS